MRQYVLLACLSPVACLMAATGQKGGKAKQKINDRQLPNVVFIYADASVMATWSVMVQRMCRLRM